MQFEFRDYGTDRTSQSAANVVLAVMFSMFAIVHFDIITVPIVAAGFFLVIQVMSQMLSHYKEIKGGAPQSSKCNFAALL